MKNIFKSVLFAVALCFGATACNDDEVGYIDPGTPQNPEKEVAGTYTGTWTQTYNGVETTATGTITLTPGDNAYVTIVNVKCDDFNIDLTGPANIVKQSAGYIYYNREAGGNGFGVTYYGRVVDGVASISFTRTVKEGRLTYLYDYTFAGEVKN